MTLTLPVPRVYSDATHILANASAYADRPSLLHLARRALMTASRNGTAEIQPHRQRPAVQTVISPPVISPTDNPPNRRPVLRAIRGDRA